MMIVVSRTVHGVELTEDDRIYEKSKDDEKEKKE